MLIPHACIGKGYSWERYPIIIPEQEQRDSKVVQPVDNTT